MNSTQEIIAAADGSALGNPGPAGWAWYIDEDHWACGGWEHGTNNMGELKAVLDLFEATASRPEAKLRVYCDSQYVINSLTKWMPGWKKKGWKKSDGKPVLNRDLLEALDNALTGRDYEFIWVKGHAGHELNEKADSLANGAARAYQEGRTPDGGPGFGASAAAREGAPAQGEAASEAPATPAPEGEPASSADAHLPVEDFTAAEIENAQRGVQSLRLSGLLRPASAVNSPPSVPPSVMRRPWLASRRPPARLLPRRLRRRTTWPVWKSLPGSTRTMWIPPNCWVRAQSSRSPQKPLHLRKPPPPRGSHRRPPHPLLPSRLLPSPLFPHLLSPPCLLCLPCGRLPRRCVPRMPPPPNSCWKAEAPSWTRLSWTPCSTSAWCG